MDGGWVVDESTRPREASGPALDADPVVDLLKRDVDRTLLREQLRRPVEVRVRNMIAALRFAEALRGAARRGRST